MSSETTEREKREIKDEKELRGIIGEEIKEALKNADREALKEFMDFSVREMYYRLGVSLLRTLIDCGLMTQAKLAERLEEDLLP